MAKGIICYLPAPELHDDSVSGCAWLRMLHHVNSTWKTQIESRVPISSLHYNERHKHQSAETFFWTCHVHSLLPLTWETRWLGELRVRLRVGIDNWQVLRSPKLILPLISVFTVGLPSARTRQLGLEAGITHLLVGMRISTARAYSHGTFSFTHVPTALFPGWFSCPTPATHIH